MKSGKRHLTDGMELSNKHKIRTIGEKELYKCFVILEADTIKQVEMKEKMWKEYLKRTRHLLGTKLCSRNLNKGINTSTVHFVRYSGPYLKWTRKELKQMDQRTRKLIIIHKALHPKDYVDRLHVSIKAGGRGFTSTEFIVDVSIQRLKNYIKKRGKGLICHQKLYWQHKYQMADDN